MRALVKGILAVMMPILVSNADQVTTSYKIPGVHVSTDVGGQWIASAVKDE
jgi:hypothetical protein